MTKRKDGIRPKHRRPGAPSVKTAALQSILLQDVSRIVQRLDEVEHKLERFEASGIDAGVDQEGRGALLLRGAQESFVKAEAFFRHLVDRAPLAVLNLASDGTILFANGPARSCAGVDGALVDRRWQDVFAVDSAADDWTWLTDHEGQNRDVAFVGADGERRVVGWRIFAVRGDEGGIAEFLAYGVDVTEKVLQAEDLRLNRDHLAEAQRIAGVGSFELDLQTLTLTGSDETYRILGIDKSKEPLRYESLLQQVVPEDRELKEAALAAARDGVALTIEYRIVRPDGAIRTICRTDGVVFDEHKHPTKMTGTLRDVTEQRESEARLRRSQEHLAEAQRIAGVGSFELDLQTMTLTGSDESYRILGIDKSTAPLRYESILEQVDSEDRERLRDSLAAARNGVATTLEYRIIRPDGAIRTIRREDGILFDEHRRATKLIGTIRDVTEQREIEARLRRSQEHLAEAQRIAAVGSFELDLQTMTLTASNESYRILGIEKPAEPLRYESFLELVYSEDRERLRASLAVAREGVATTLEYRIIRPDGGIRTIRRENGILFDARRRPTKVIGTIRDVTEQRETEARLRRSQEHLARAQRIAKVGSIEIDLASLSVELSAEANRIFGGGPEGWTGHSEDLLQRVVPEDRDLIRANIKAARDGLAAPIEYRIRWPDGTIRNIYREDEILFDNTGRAVRLIGTIKDVTELRESEARLRRSQEHLARAQRVAGIGSFEVDLLTKKVEWSDETYRIFGIALGTPMTVDRFVEAVLREDRGVIYHAVAESERSKVPLSTEFRIVRSDGAVRTLARDGELLFGPDGTPATFLGVLRDVTDARAAEKRREELEAQLLHAQRLDAIGTLAAGIAHDLNNTLVPVIGLVPLMMRRAASGSRDRRDLEILQIAGDRAQRLVQQVLQFCRAEAPQKQTIKLADLVRELLTMMRATLPATIRVEEEIDDVPEIWGDPGQLYQVFLNLITNAAQAIGDASGRIIVEVARSQRAADDGNTRAMIRASIIDNGRGMTKEVRARIFEPFFTTKSVNEGSGLGLSVVHGIVSAHGGRIDVQSRPGEGARFDVYLPVAGPPGVPSVTVKGAP